MKNISPVLLHIPHSSLSIPDEEKGDFLIDQAKLGEELMKLTDRYTDDLFSLKSCDRLVFGVSRLVVDPERFEEDSSEPMAKQGMGAVYTKCTDGTPLRTRVGRKRLIEKYYAPHHKSLNDWAVGAVRKHKRCLIIDCHSYPSKPLPCDLDQNPGRPMFCVGTDPYHTPETLVNSVVSGLEKIAKSLSGNASFSTSEKVIVDRPYSGTMVPSRFYRLDSGVSAIMIELNRALYMDEVTGEKLESYPLLKKKLTSLLQSVVRDWEKDAEEDYDTPNEWESGYLDTGSRTMDNGQEFRISYENGAFEVVQQGGEWCWSDLAERYGHGDSVWSESSETLGQLLDGACEFAGLTRAQMLGISYDGDSNDSLRERLEQYLEMESSHSEDMARLREERLKFQAELEQLEFQGISSRKFGDYGSLFLEATEDSWEGWISFLAIPDYHNEPVSSTADTFDGVYSEIEHMIPWTQEELAEILIEHDPLWARFV
jgi:N-formylglutamate amidohydrolase